VTAVNDTAAGLAGARAQLAGFATQMRSAIGAIGAGVSLAAMNRFVRTTVEAADRQSDMAAQLGVTAAALTRLQYAAELGGSSTESLNTALGRMNKTLGDVATGGGSAAAKVFRQIGLDAQALANLTPDRAFVEIAEAVSRIQNPAERARVAMTLFGKSGQDVINVLAMGKKGLREFGEESDRVFFTLTEGSEQAVDAADKAIKRFDVMKTALGRQVVATGVPTQILETWTNYIAKIREASAVMKVWRLTPVGIFYTNMVEGSDKAKASTEALTAAMKKQAAVIPPAPPAFKPPPVPEGFKERGQILADLIRQQEEFGKTEGEITLYRLAMLGATEDEKRMAQSLIQANDAMEQRNKVMEEQKERIEELNREMDADAARMADRGKQLFEQMRTPLERYNAELEELNLLLNRGAINQDTFTRARDAAKMGLGEELMRDNKPQQFAAAVERRFTFTTPEQQRQKDPVEVAEKALREQEQTKKNTKDTATAVQSLNQKIPANATIGVFTLN
jgi:hypothetical protein